MPLKGIDVSHHNIPVDWDAFKREGCDFVIIKSSQGLWTQHTWDGSRTNDGHPITDFYSAAKRRGMGIGAYHFLMSRDTHIVGRGGKRLRDAGVPNQATGRQQARYFIAAVKRVNGGTLDGVVCCVDLEALNVPLSNGEVMRSRPDRFDLRDFEREFHRMQPNRPLIVYTTNSYWSKIQLQGLRNPKRTYLWLAAWIYKRNSSSGQRTPSSYFDRVFNGKRPIIWQYGILNWRGNGLTDTNAFDGDSLADWRRYARNIGGSGNPDPDPDPVDPPDPDPVDPPDPDPVDPPDPPDPPVNGDPWSEPWLDPGNGEYSPRRLAIVTSNASGGTSINPAAMVIIAGIVAGGGFLAWRYRDRITDWLDTD